MNISPAIFQHPKFVKLKRAVGPTALHHLARLWAFCQMDQRGEDLGKLSPEDLELLAEWDGGTGNLYAKLLEIGWIDVNKRGHVVIHDWNDHNRNLVRNWSNGKYGHLGGLAKKNGHPESPPTADPQATQRVATPPAVAPHKAPPMAPPLDRIGLDRSTEVHTHTGATDPSLQEVINWGAMDGVPEEVCREFYDYNAGVNWMIGNTRLANPRPWLKRFWERRQNVKNRPSGGGVFAKKVRVETLEKLMAEHPAHPNSNCASEATEEQRSEYAKWKLELKKLRREIAEGDK